MSGDQSLPDNRLPRDRRLITSADFLKIKEKGQRLVIGAIIANWLPNNLDRSRLGVITPAKIGRAHDRSRARRLLRESFRLHQHDLAGPLDIVLVARNSIAGKTFQEVEQNFLAILNRAKLLRAK